MKQQIAKLLPLNCGKHFGAGGGDCRKCKYFGQLYARPEIRRGLQYNGVPWVAAIADTRRD